MSEIISSLLFLQLKYFVFYNSTFDSVKSNKRLTLFLSKIITLDLASVIVKLFIKHLKLFSNFFLK